MIGSHNLGNFTQVRNPVDWITKALHALAMAFVSGRGKMGSMVNVLTFKDSMGALQCPI